MTRAGREYQKHMGEPGIPEVKGSQLNEAGQQLLDDIITDPNSRLSNVTKGNQKGGIRVVRPDGTGATFGPNGDLGYFGVNQR